MYSLQEHRWLVVRWQVLVKCCMLQSSKQLNWPTYLCKNIPFRWYRWGELVVTESNLLLKISVKSSTRNFCLRTSKFYFLLLGVIILKNFLHGPSEYPQWTITPVAQEGTSMIIHLILAFSLSLFHFSQPFHLHFCSQKPFSQGSLFGGTQVKTGCKSALCALKIPMLSHQWHNWKKVGVV